MLDKACLLYLYCYVNGIDLVDYLLLGVLCLGF